MNQKIWFLNQSSGSLFIELVEDIANQVDRECVLITGSTEYLKNQSDLGQLNIKLAPSYNSSASLHIKLISWSAYCIYAFCVCVLQARTNDIIITTTNPPFNGIIAWLLNRIKKIYYINIIYDIYPDVLVAFGKIDQDSHIDIFWRKINKKVMENSQAVITLGEFMANRLENQFNPRLTNYGKVIVVPPWVDTNYIQPIPKKQNKFIQDLAIRSKIIILYSGNFGISHDINSILEAAQLMKERRDIHFLLIGKGAKWHEAVEYQQQHELQNITILPYQPNSVYPYSVAGADIALVSLEPEAESLMLPSKTYYSMAAGSAIVGICGYKNDLRETIIKNKCGICVEPNKPDELAKVLLKLVDSKSTLDELKRNSREAAENIYSRKAQKDSFINLIKDLKLI